MSFGALDFMPFLVSSLNTILIFSHDNVTSLDNLVKKSALSCTLAKPESLFDFEVRDVHLIKQERKKPPCPSGSAGEKGLCLAGTGRGCGELQPAAQLVCSQILLSKSYPKSAMHLGMRALLCLLTVG